MMKKLLLIIFLSEILQSLHAQRNTILIIADDLSPDYFGFYEDYGDTVSVPNIRSLLARGVRFKHLTSNPVCSSTRSSILTGRYGFRTGVGNIVGGTGGSGTLDTAEVTIPKLLRTFNSQIARANIGKWHLHNPVPTSNLLNPLALGYQWYEGPFIGALPSYTNWVKYTNGVPDTITTYATTENVNNALTWLKAQNSSYPFFLWLAFNAPHTPYHLPPNNLHTYTLSGTTQDITQNPKAYFKASLQALDTEIGRLFDSLQAMNKWDSTDIIFIGDNGNAERVAQIADITKAKGTIYEYGVHVPCIIAGPTVVNPGRTSDALINTVDLFATILQNFSYSTWSSQIPFNKPVDAKSVTPILLNQTDSIRPWSFCEIFKNIPDSADGKAIRNRDYKLIKFDYGAEEFYHLKSDPLESTNLINATLTTEDISNYYYLCEELNKLLNKTNECTSTIGIQESMLPTPKVFPNPFSSQIQITEENTPSILYNSIGEKIYEGKAIEKQNFSNLPNGVYFLQLKENEFLKLIK